MNTGKIGAKRIALGAVLAALTVITLWAAGMLPVNRISLYALSSFYIAIIVIEHGIGSGWVLYAASSLLAIIIIPDKAGVVPYVTFFGLYGIVKSYIERINKAIVEFGLKLLFFNLNLAVALILAFWFLDGMFSTDIFEKLPLWLFILMLQPVFIIYDYVYTLFIMYYRHVLGKMVHR